MDFWDNTYGTGDVIFEKANFSGSHVILAKQNFGDGGVSFENAVFGDKGAHFSENKYGKGGVSFVETTFGGGRIDFSKNVFAEGSVNFSKAKFGDCDLSFGETDFGGSDLLFGLCEFGTGTVDFRKAKFGKGKLDFSWAQFADTYLIFEDSEFGETHVDFSKSEFRKPARFDKLKSLENVTRFSFEGCSFEKLFTFSHEGRMGCPLDLRRTKLAHTLVVHDIECDYAKRPARFPCLPRTAADREDSQRFRRLKELAVANRNHAKALEFHAKEIRSQRGHTTNLLQDTLQFFYWVLSDYGKSVMRPFCWILASAVTFAALFWHLRDPSLADDRNFLTALTYSFSNMLAFVPTGRTAKQQGEELLFGETVPDLMLFLGGGQTILSVILLFLLGLGLRNMFRV